CHHHRSVHVVLHYGANGPSTRRPSGFLRRASHTAATGAEPTRRNRRERFEPTTSPDSSPRGFHPYGTIRRAPPQKPPAPRQSPPTISPLPYEVAYNPLFALRRVDETASVHFQREPRARHQHGNLHRYRRLAGQQQTEAVDALFRERHPAQRHEHV